MLNPLFCGTSTFHHEDDEPCLAASPGSSPRKSKRKDNPYSTRGLDKFSELLADLDEKRQKIYSQMSPQDISFVRFVYSSTDDFVPIVVKVKKNNKDHNKHKSQELRVVKAPHLINSTSELIPESNDVVGERKQQPKLEFDAKEANKKRFSWNLNKLDVWKPSFYLPIVVILILVFLVVFGRSIATLCTCILWYVIPTLKDRSSSNPMKSMKKKDCVRGLSEIKKKDYVRGLSEIKKKDYVRGLSENKKKDYVRGWSEKKINVVNEEMKKKNYVRGWSEKKMVIDDGLLSPIRDDSEASKNNSPRRKHSHKKSF